MIIPNSQNKKPPINKIEAYKDKTEWQMDEKGYFLIDPRVEEGIIYAHHYTADKKYHCSIEGTDAESIYYTILREGLVSSFMHAAYLGSELQKAQILIYVQQGIYIQDKDLYLSVGNESEEE